MPSYVTKTISKHRRLFLLALLAGGVGAGLYWTWDTRRTPPDPFAEDYTDAELAERIQRGAAVFAEHNCAECHVTSRDAINHDAAGIGLKGPPLVGIVGQTVTLESGRIVARDHRYLARSIRDSRSDLVKGYAFQVMPDYSFLDDQDVAALLLYIRSLEEGQAASPPSDGADSTSE